MSVKDQIPLLKISPSDEEREELVAGSPLSERNFAITFTELSKLVKQCNLEKLKEVLKGRDVQLTDSKGSTILHVAAVLNNVEALHLLLKHKRCLALLDRQDQSGATPLLAALQSDSWNTLELLCSRGADVTKRHPWTGENILHLASDRNDPRGAEILIKYNASPEFINCIDYYGDAPLIAAVRVGSPVFDMLMSAGAVITSRNHENGRTILHVIVAYNRKSMLTAILKHPDATKEFADIPDVSGDTALMIAVRLQRLEVIKILTSTFNKLNGINSIENESVIHISVQNNKPDILKTLLDSTLEHSINYVNGECKTPILLAAELNYAACLQLLIEIGADYHLTNIFTGETMFHVVARYHSNTTLPFLMSLPYVSWFFVKKDEKGYTPYMTAIACGNATFLHEVFKVKQIDFLDINSRGETPIYYAIKQGYPKVLFTLLLSRKYYSFAKQSQITLDYKDRAVIRNAEIRGEIYATDVYILLNEIIENPLVAWFPPSLLIKTKEGRSVFHACALGGNLECLEFMYNFYKVFASKEYISAFDEPSPNGDTPLLYAAQCGNVPISCVHFFVTNGADLGATNNKGLNVVQALYMNNPEASSMFKNIFNSCVTAKKEHYYSDDLNIILDFKVLCPKEDSQTKVICTLFNESRSDEEHFTLQHPVVILFLKNKLHQIKGILYFRFIATLLMSIEISILLPILHIHQNKSGKIYEKYILYWLLVLSIILSSLQAIFKLPAIIRKDIWFTDIVAFVPPIAMSMLAYFGFSNYFAEELVAATILSTWICILFFMINLFSRFSYQIAVYFRLLNNISQHLLLLSVLIFAFSLSFYCIYHTDKRFSNFPKSFIYTFIVMLPGYISEVPTFNREYFSNTPNTFHFIVEGVILLVFLVVAVVSFVNMIVGLAVRGGEFLEEDGEIFQNYTVIHYLAPLEYVFHNKFCKFLVKRIKVFKNIKTNIYINTFMSINNEENEKIVNKHLGQQIRAIVCEKYKDEKSSKPQKSTTVYFEDDSFGYLPGAA